VRNPKKVPIYGYRCANCGHQLEVMQKVSAEPLKVCPNCQEKLVKMVYPAGVIFKGSGFYSTDYKGSGKSASDNGSAPTTEGKSEPPKPKETKSESKSESSD
jgi:putative FmdB family regulatory protein